MKKVLAILLFLLAGCNMGYTLPRPDQMEEYPFGCLSECYTTDGTRYQGELISVEGDSLFILIFTVPRKAVPPDPADSTLSPGSLYALAKKDITGVTALVSLSGNKGRDVTVWAALLSLATLSHGRFFIFSLPVNAVVNGGAIATVYGANYIDYPAHMDWKDLYKFARFPQGIPAGVDRTKLQ